MITNGLLATSTAQTVSLGEQALTSFVIALAGGAAAALLAWVGFLNKWVEKRIDEKVATRLQMRSDLMEPHIIEQLQRITFLAYRARNAARDFVQTGDGGDRSAQLDEFRKAAGAYQKSIEENRYLLETVVGAGAFAKAHGLKAALLTFKNTATVMTTGDDPAEISDRYEALNTQFDEFMAAGGVWFSGPDGARKP